MFTFPAVPSFAVAAIVNVCCHRVRLVGHGYERCIQETAQVGLWATELPT
jgi:hypothetical protein